MAAAAQIAGEERLTGGKFYGSVVSKQAVGGAIFTELQHSQPRKPSRLFRKFTGTGIGEYVHKLGIREACERMLDPEQSLADISCELDFADQSHFTSTFHGIAGMSPGRFRGMLSKSAITSVVSLHRHLSWSNAGLRL